MFLAAAVLSVLMMVVCVVWEIAERSRRKRGVEDRERAGSEARALVKVAEPNPSSSDASSVSDTSSGI